MDQRMSELPSRVGRPPQGFPLADAAPVNAAPVTSTESNHLEALSFDDVCRVDPSLEQTDGTRQRQWQRPLHHPFPTRRCTPMGQPTTPK